MTPAQVLIATLQCVHASSTISLCDSVLNERATDTDRRVAAAVKIEATRQLGFASLQLVDAGANVLDAVRYELARRRGWAA